MLSDGCRSLSWARLNPVLKAALVHEATFQPLGLPEFPIFTPKWKSSQVDMNSQGNFQMYLSELGYPPTPTPGAEEGYGEGAGEKV